jgi:hypothetical protein
MSYLLLAGVASVNHADMKHLAIGELTVHALALSFELASRQMLKQGPECSSSTWGPLTLCGWLVVLCACI